MFHRVKPEIQPEDKIQDKESQAESLKQKEDNQSEASAIKDSPVSESVSREGQEEKKVPSHPVNVQPQPMKKEAESMTDRTMPSEAREKASSEKNERRPSGFSSEIPSGAAYGRSGQAPLRQAGNYPGAYPGATSSSTYASSRPSTATGSSDSDRTLTIGAGITMSGEIESCDYLLVEGTVEAALKGARSLEIAESGVFYGTVEIEDATIAGRFEGDITVHGRLTLLSTGSITGSITYNDLEIESGAVVDGRLTPVSAAQAQNQKSEDTASRSSSAKPAPKKSQSPANSDGELFAPEKVLAE